MRFLVGLLRNFIVVSVLAGIASAIGAYLAKGRLMPSGEPADDEIEVVAIYDTANLASTAPALRRARVTAWYGGGTLDLRDATLDPAGARLTVRAIFGGYRVLVPETWRVELTSVGIFGGIGDIRRKDLVAEGGPILTIDGFAVFGGVGILSEAPDLDRAAAPDLPAEIPPVETLGAAAPA
jgi:hypothetical protein